MAPQALRPLLFWIVAKGVHALKQWGEWRIGHVALRCGPAVPLYKRGFIGLVIHRSWASLMLLAFQSKMEDLSVNPSCFHIYHPLSFPWLDNWVSFDKTDIMWVANLTSFIFIGGQLGYTSMSHVLGKYCYGINKTISYI